LVCTDDLLYYGKQDADVKTLYQYASSNGISLRDDSPLVDWYLQNNLKTWSISHPQFYDPLYLTKPIVFELQHYGMVKKDGNWLGKNGAEKIAKYGYSGAEVMRKAIETMHATYIGYHGYAEEWLADNPDLTNELANRCGYWYFPVSASFPSIIKQSENEIAIEWINKGVAPAYSEYGLVIRFESENSQNSFNLLPVNSRNKEWLPGVSKIENYKFGIPDKVQKGSYRLKFKLIEQSESNTTLIQTGIKTSLVDPDGFVELGTIQIR